MTLTWPLPLADFWDCIPLAQGSTWDLDEAVETERTAGGVILSASLGEALWTGEVVFDVATRAERSPASALLSAIRRPGAPFMAYDRRRPYPLADPGGALLGSATPTIAALDTGDRSQIQIAGLPAGYQLSAGDLIGWSHGTSPVRYALHEIVVDVAADGTGATGPVPIAPHWRTGTATGLAVTLIRPPMVATYVPGSHSPGRGRSGGIEAGRSFRILQTLEY